MREKDRREKKDKIDMREKNNMRERWWRKIWEIRERRMIWKRDEGERYDR